MISLLEKICACYPHTIELREFSSVQSVGIGLFLGLAVLQIITVGGLSSLYRKTDRLRDAVESNNLNGQRQRVRRIRNQLVTLEQSVQSFGATVFGAVLVLVAIAVAGLGYSTLNLNVPVSCYYGYGILVYNLGLPVVIFLLVAGFVRKMSKSVRNDLATFERELVALIAAQSP
ncbi:hypothetical protein [Tropicimonas marinistellae]|uniref:hypothetical protein n=1 Tax=Tropicimonas marinistellae TaxID=1739787 RepID=UPI00082AA90F|nr:hypothetical protein [Tropicimonas marinistellae]